MSAFTLSLVVPQQVTLSSDFSEPIDRQLFFDWLWAKFSDAGLIGIHEGTLLSEEAAEQGLETDSWTVDSAEAPRERDWVGGVVEGHVELYFSTQEAAQAASVELGTVQGVQIGEVKEQEDQDWDAQWKASFLNEGRGVEVLPHWRIVPPWVESSAYPVSDHLIRINPGAGFGTGTHETTQLCLQAIGEYSKETPLQAQKALDFGSGSGILSIAMAQSGARVLGVEVDPLAIDNAKENATLNQVEKEILFSDSLSKGTTYRWVVANILRPVLLEFAEKLVGSLDVASGSVLVLSGLIATDVESVVAEYSKRLQIPVTQIYEKGEWRALVFRVPPRTF